MVSVEKPWLICGYHVLTIVMFFIIIGSKTMVNIHKDRSELCLTARKVILRRSSFIKMADANI